MNVLILICALSISAPDCQRSTATHVFQTPGPVDAMGGCLRQGMLYAASSGLVTPGTYPKVVCSPLQQEAGQAIRRQ